MANIEQLWKTSVRMAVETTFGSGIGNGQWVRPELSTAAVSRDIKTQAEKRDVFRQLKQREIVSESWTLAMGGDAKLAFLAWLLGGIMTDRGSDVFALDPETDGVSYVVETTSENGDIAVYSGCQLAELTVVIEDRRIVRLEMSLACLRRQTPDDPLAGTTYLDVSGDMMPTYQVGLAISAAYEWGSVPRTDNAVTMHGGQLVFTREIAPANFGPDGIPSSFARRPWRVMGELMMPETAGVTDVAFASEWTGGIMLWLTDGDPVLVINNAVGFVSDEDLVAYDFRVRRLAFEAMTDADRALIEFRA